MSTNFAVRFFPAREIFSQTSGKARDFLRRGKAFVFEAIMKGSSTSLPRVKCVLIFGDRPNFSLFLFFFAIAFFIFGFSFSIIPAGYFRLWRFEFARESVRSIDTIGLTNSTRGSLLSDRRMLFDIGL